MSDENHVVVFVDGRGRVVCMDTITYANEDYGPADVLIGGSWMGVVPVSFAAPFRPRAIICNDGGVGKDGGGINGLYYLDGLCIAAASASSTSCEIANGLSHWETGSISHVNHWAAACGCRPGMSVQECALHMLDWNEHKKLDAPPRDGRTTAYVSTIGEIVTVDSIKYVNESDRDKVVVIGSHGGVTTCSFAIAAAPRGVIVSDGGRGRDAAGTRGLGLLDNENIPGAAVSVHSAAIGDGRGIYEFGIISEVNNSAVKLGVRPGMPAREVAMFFLKNPLD